MLKEATYKEKFSLLTKWMPVIVDSVKKDLKAEHLKKDWNFVKNYFPGKNPAKLTTEELSAAYSDAIANSENGEEFAEFVTNRWLLKHTDLYHYFEQALSKINPNFSEIDKIDEKTANAMMEESVSLHGAPQTYLFCVFNSVVFPEDVLAKLSHRAEEAKKKSEVETESKKENESIEAMQRNHDQLLARLTDKYEKKLLGLQKKYTLDTEVLKKQIATLQRKLTA